MKKVYQGLLYIILCFILFFQFPFYVSADAFKIDLTELKGAKDANNNDIMTQKKYRTTGAGAKASIVSEAYCADHEFYFHGYTTSGNPMGAADISYVQDPSYASANNCVYNGGAANDGDCSRIIGYIIGHSKSYYASKGYSSNQIWYWTQVTVWAYLAKFAPSNLDFHNNNASSLYDRYNDIKQVIQSAWSDYSSHKTLSETKDDVQFDLVSSGSNEFYYVPSTSSCSSGFYKTQEIKITNQQSHEAIKLNLSTTSSSGDEILICKSNTSECAAVYNSILLPANQSYSFYLKSNKDVSGNVSLNVTAFYDSNAIFSTDYDSVRWITPSQGALPSNNKAQSYITATSASSSGTVQHISSKSLSFSKQKIDRRGCDVSMSGSLSNKNSSSNPVQKVCADKSSNISDTSTYTADFKGCTCFGLDLGNDRYVNIIVTETVVFQFGKLSPDDVLYAGGGFAFADSGITTQYVSKVAWTYADTKNGVPYYYNKNNLSDNDARNVATLINQKLLDNKIKDELELKFQTKNSNDYQDTELFELSLKLPLNSPEFVLNSDGNYQYSFNSGDIKMNQAYFSVDGKVKYGESDDVYTIDGGNKYYIPMYYKEETFPFNISTTDLSIVVGINFWYQADCDKQVQEKYKSLYYRSIDVTNPFPKAGNVSSKVPENWRLWYCGDGETCTGNTANQNRLKNTYQKYPNTPLYRATLDSNKLNKINSITDYYTSWSNVNDNGVSSFVTSKDIFEIFPNDTSYCHIGEFKESCDNSY